MTCLPERDSFSWCGTSDNYSGVFLNKINKIWQPPLINSWDCVSYFWQSPNTCHFCRINPRLLQSYSSFSMFHQQVANTYVYMFCFKKVYSFALSCPQFPVENRKIHLTYESGICQNSFQRNFWKHPFFLACDPGIADTFFLSGKWLKIICYFYSCQVHLTIFFLIFTCMLQKVDAFTFCFPELRSPGG